MRARPIRVVHVLGSLSVGGVETWLSQLVQRLDRTRVETHFLLHSGGGADPYAPAALAAGCRIEAVPLARRPWAYGLDFWNALRRLGPVDVVHSHVHHFSGLVLFVAARSGVPLRIAHSHSDTSKVDRGATPARRAYLAAMRHLIRRYATSGLAASEPAATALFGRAWQENGRYSVLHCGVDLRRFRELVHRDRVRLALGIGRDDLVVGHLGSFIEPKNHRFMVEVAANLVAMEPRARFLWVGDGPLLPEIRALVERAGLSRNVLLPGLRMDVPEVLAAMDVFLFPSLWEGMPLALVEAQASGLPCVVSDAVAPESFVVVGAVRSLALDAGALRWAAAVRAAWRPDRWERRLDGLAQVERSTFDLDAGARALEEAYRAG